MLTRDECRVGRTTYFTPLIVTLLSATGACKPLAQRFCVAPAPNIR